MSDEVYVTFKTIHCYFPSELVEEFNKYSLIIRHPRIRAAQCSTVPSLGGL